MSVLEKILADKRVEVEARKAATPVDALEARARDVPPPRSLRKSLLGGGLRVIAEVKKASPSKGIIRADFDPVAIGAAYERAGAAACSVLTDEKYFQGSLEHLTRIRERIALPVLRKDFILDPYQVVEARAAGADAILLIVAAFTGIDRMAELAGDAEARGMDVLWEVHTEEELRRLLPLEPKIVGVNNRDLRTFQVSLETTRALLPLMPPDAASVSESGLANRAELDRLRGWGVNAFLVGESLMRAPDPGAALAALIA